MYIKNSNKSEGIAHVITESNPYGLTPRSEIVDLQQSQVLWETLYFKSSNGT